MPSPRKRSMQRAATTSRVAEHAREVAAVGDRWFLSLAGGVGRAGGWARKEADIVADSAVAAFATTMTVAKALTSLVMAGLEPAKGSVQDGEAHHHELPAPDHL